MPSDMDAFRTHVLGDAALQEKLDASRDPAVFRTSVVRAARAAGLRFDAAAADASRRSNAVPPGEHWAPEGWLPTGIVEDADGAWVDWARFGTRRLVESFYGDSVDRALSRPFNRLFRHATRLDDFVANAPRHAAAPLAGMVFHMSRCGSTLVAQMLAALPATVSLSEPGPLDAAVRYALRHPELPRDRQIALLRAMLCALARRRDGETRCFVKLDSWHILAQPLLAEAFPDVPWVYLFRDPVEVLVSQMRRRGYQTVPALLPPGLYGADVEQIVAPPLLCARIFARHHAAALEALRHGGLAIDYATLPGAFYERIAPHFGLRLSAAERAAVAAASTRDAKRPEARFLGDSAHKQAEASPALIEAAARHLAALHARLQAIGAVAPP